MAHDPPRLLMSSVAGSPADPRTWSGTPAQLLNALAADGRVAPVPHSSRLPDAVARRAARRDALLGLRHPFIPGFAARRLAARGVTAAARDQRCAAVLHLSSYDLPLAPAGPPRFVYVDNNFELWRQSRAAAGLGRWQRHWLAALERRSLRQARHIFTIGRHVADSFASEFGIPRERLSAVGSGPGGIAPYSGPRDYAAGRLLTVAKRRREDKGLPLLLEAFRRARATRPDLTLTVIGGVGYSEAEATAGVRCTGWIEQADLQRIYEQSSLFVMPATYEPWGLSYLEALACRIPIMGLSRYAFPEISGDGAYGFTVEAPRPEALAAAILDALADPARLERMGREGQAHGLRHYRWDRVAGAIAARIRDQLENDA